MIVYPCYVICTQIKASISCKINCTIPIHMVWDKHAHIHVFWKHMHDGMEQYMTEICSANNESVWDCRSLHVSIVGQGKSLAMLAKSFSRPRSSIARRCRVPTTLDTSWHGRGNSSTNHLVGRQNSSTNHDVALGDQCTTSN